MKRTKENDEQFNINQGTRKSKRTRVPVQQVPDKRSKRTRGKAKQSSQEFGLPQNIPISDTEQLITYKSSQRETSKIIFQIPLHLFKSGKMGEVSDIAVESTLIQIKPVLKDSQTISIEAKVREEPVVDEADKEDKVYVVWGKSCWVSSYQVSTKIIKQGMKIIRGQFNEIAKVKTVDVNSDIFIVLNFREQIQCTSDYNGLINQGNTCYMNSYLQMLNHISEFRGLVFDAEVEDESRFPATLQILFYRLGNDQKSVSAESLVRSFGWSRKEAQIQQDAQEFSCLFFQVLEKKLIEVCHEPKHLTMGEIFEGKLLHYIECTNVDYRSVKDERFFDIQLNITNNLYNSLDEYVSEQILSGDNMYDTEIYGKQEAKKGVKIEVLPPILMIQLKRFQFSPVTYQNQKVMERFQYPNEIDFSKWLLTGQSQVYQLYAVLVHEGAKAQSGHYYAYLKVNDGWYKFNDQEVTKVHERRVFEYNFGGLMDVVELDSREMQVKMRKLVSSSTAYMLVYVKKELKESLLDRETIYPEWLKERDILKMEEREEQKARKNYYHDIQVLSWEKGFQGNDAGQIGFLNKEKEGLVLQDLGKIAKTQKLVEWVKPYNNEGIGAYLHITCPDKTEYECVVNLQGRTGNFQETLRENVNPVIIFAPYLIKPESYMVVVKMHLIEEEKKGTIKYDTILEVDKNETNSKVIKMLKEKYDDSNYETKFFIEEKKSLTPIVPNEKSFFITQSVRNCLVIIIVEKKKIGLSNSEVTSTEQWYSKQKNTLELILKSDDGKYEFVVTIDQYHTIGDLRNLIFEERLSGDDDYASPQNIIIKSKQKKTAKIFSENRQSKIVKDLIKSCDKQKVVMFCPSTLNADERVSQLEIKVRYRFKDLSFSESFHIVLSKQSSEQNIFYKTLFNHQIIQEYVNKQKGKDIRVLIFTKDFYLINDIVEKNGYVVGKGPIISVLQKQKGANLIVQSVDHEENDEMWPVLINHISMTSDRVGRPRCVEFPKSIKLSKLRQQIIELLKDESIEWEEKVYQINLLKLEMHAYVKDFKKAIQLVEYVSVDETNETKKNGEDLIIKQEPQDKENEEEKEEHDSKEEKQDLKEEKKQEKTLEKAFPKAKFVKVIIRHLHLTKALNPMKIKIE